MRSPIRTSIGLAVAVLAASLAPIGMVVAGHSGNHSISDPLAGSVHRSGAWATWSDYRDFEQTPGAEKVAQWTHRTILVWRHEGIAAGEGTAESWINGGAAASVETCSRRIDTAWVCELTSLWRAPLERFTYIGEADLGTAALRAAFDGPAGTCTANVIWQPPPRSEPGAVSPSTAEGVSVTASALSWAEPQAATDCWDTGSGQPWGQIWRASDVAVTP